MRRDRHDYLLRLFNAFETKRLPLEADHSAEFASFARELDERGQSISHSLPASHAMVIDSYTSTAVPTDRVETLMWIVQECSIPTSDPLDAVLKARGAVIASPAEE